MNIREWFAEEFHSSRTAAWAIISSWILAISGISFAVLPFFGPFSYMRVLFGLLGLVMVFCAYHMHQFGFRYAKKSDIVLMGMVFLSVAVAMCFEPSIPISVKLPILLSSFGWFGYLLWRALTGRFGR